jgi:cytochrome oxidase Cu insertion factor (SCO1/SenC/PrrC family)
LAAVVAVGLLVRGLGAGDGAASVTAPSASVGVTLDRPIPATVASLPLTDQAGRSMTLDAWRGRTVLLSPFLTSCQEECPLTTGALLAVQHSLLRAGLGSRVSIVEVTVDTGRDKPPRLAAYAHLTGSTWTLLAGSSQTIRQFWHWVGVYYQKVPEGSPPDIDWQTHRPYTYDVDYSDGFMVIDGHLDERFVAGGMARIGSLSPQLRGLVRSQGEANLHNPGPGSWTADEAVSAVKWTIQHSTHE